ncbi:chemotaxis protein CheW [Dehalococcoidia bacterium]|nr:chemotaxis protein CheW [Dehalococcoidia bacterium]MCL0102640.1 chemotaxis protein CheW [Dehalococcoidia bacterium]
MGDNGTTTTMAEQQLVVFDLADESYGVDIGKVSEIIRTQKITRVPRTTEVVEGVINLRGKIIPVVNLRMMFGFAAGEKSKENRIVVVDIDGQNIGITVDAVTEVLRIPAESVEPPSSVITTADTDYLLGIAKLDEKMVILLDLDRVLTHRQSAELAEMASPAVEESLREVAMAAV